MMDSVANPDWVPKLSPGNRVLIVGASGGIGRSVVRVLLKSTDIVLGVHATCRDTFGRQGGDGQTILPLTGRLDSEASCAGLVDAFCEKAHGIQGLVVLCGGITKNDHWRSLSEQDWMADINLNLNVPFYLARRAISRMKDQASPGSIILMGTESSLHGGSPTSFPYAVAKRGVECLVQGLAREGAAIGVTVNGVRPGFIASGFHERWQDKGYEALAKRAAMVPLRRAGKPEEVAVLIAYLLSGWARFITGQMLAITGGDWL